MKTRSILLAAGLLLAGCSKKSNDPNPAGPGSGAPSTLSAKVTGYPDVAYSSPTGALNTALSASRIPSTDPQAAPYIMRVYAGTNTEGIRLQLNKFTGVGTYVLYSNYDESLPGGTSSANYLNGTSSFGTSVRPGVGIPQGQVVVTSYDVATRRIKGTFYFTASNTVIPPATPQSRQVTDGVFDVAVNL